MATTDFNIDQSLCNKKNDGGESATCVFDTLTVGEDATLKSDQIKSTTYELICGCLLFTGDDEENKDDSEEE